MFGKLKQFKDLRHQAKSLKSMLAEQQVSVEKNGIVLVMDGNQKVISLVLPEVIDKSDLAATLPDLINEAIAKVQRLMVEKMQSSGFNLPKF